ncbi:D-alanyl-D-alanine carboxypeptidase [Streptomyces jumonjinensis]|uniref:D-alanyl-D-alanine carboxypeptidase n=1 Tax=Streptomyces jumonjinensis TaxID=1945 RepID=A0A646KEC5_STRJU|nr:D-alanyl-D-alanine carboxypeptidase [Streptomyces jumonjinensis]
MAPTTVPRIRDVTASSRWTQKYAVGSPASSNASPLPSCQRFLAKVIQMTQLHTPKASRNQDAGRLSFIHPVSGAPVGRGSRGGPSWRRLRRVINPISIFSVLPCTFTSVSALKKSVLTATAAALLPLVLVAPASATTHDDKPKGTSKSKTRKQPNPPAAMSTVGGPLLGRSGTQVRLGAGAPVLPEELSGRSWIVADAESGDVLASHNAHWRLPPASTLKMLFADTLLPKLPKATTHEVAPEDLENVGPGSSLVGVKENLSYSVHDLWLGVFLRSGNDAVHVLSAMNGGIDKTVADMQAHAEELQALDTQVVSPDGYDASGQVSSAYDLTLIARSGMQKKDFREYASTVSAEFPGEGEGEKRETFEIQNTNRLLTGDYGMDPYKGVAGIKNGSTTHAGATFTGVAERKGKVLLVTVMNPDSGEDNAVYKEAGRLLDWGFEAAGKVTPVGELVAPRSTSGADTGGAGPHQESDDPGSEPVAAAKDGAGTEGAEGREDTAGASGGMGAALAITGGVLVVLAAGVFVVNRRWPSRRP